MNLGRYRKLRTETVKTDGPLPPLQYTTYKMQISSFYFTFFVLNEMFQQYLRHSNEDDNRKVAKILNNFVFK